MENEKTRKLKFIKLPMGRENGIEQKEFEEMLGYIYEVYYSSFGNGYVIVSGETKEAEEAFASAVYKTLISAGESKEYAKDCAYGSGELDMCLYIPRECFKESDTCENGR